MPQKTIDSIFKRKHADTLSSILPSTSTLDHSVAVNLLSKSIPEERPPKSPRVEPSEINMDRIECDPAKRCQIWEYLLINVTQFDEVIFNWDHISIMMKTIPYLEM
ncbi:hypothetical protein M0R45_035441 [Rubus argutus]|uniref:Uncharacterized protein n=1 Tax=Rubus argutus TaxID=59490 RepID=A0AAW1VUV5_RUBAR